MRASMAVSVKKAVALLVVIAALAAALFVFVRRGFSTRTAPTAIEARIAGTLRALSLPSRYKQLRNPVECGEGALTDARAHWADHCATCHANNGSGDSMLGRTMYPRPPEMAGPGTQTQTDGELYYTIKNGVRLSGMPAFGDSGDNDTDSWKLVCFVRRLPRLTSEEISEMKNLNPKTPDDLAEERQEKEFLNGGAEAPPASQNEHHHH